MVDFWRRDVEHNINTLHTAVVTLLEVTKDLILEVKELKESSRKPTSDDGSVDQQ